MLGAIATPAGPLCEVTLPCHRPRRRWTAGHRGPSPAKQLSVNDSRESQPSGSRRQAFPIFAMRLIPIRFARGGDGAMSGDCNGRPFVADLGGNGPPPQDQNSGHRGNSRQAAVTRNYLPGEIVAETRAMPDAELAALARRHRIDRIVSQNFPLTGTTVSLFRIVGRRPVEEVQAELRADAAVRSAQPNFRYVLQDQKTAVQRPKATRRNMRWQSCGCRKRIRCRTAATSPLR